MESRRMGQAVDGLVPELFWGKDRGLCKQPPVFAL